MKLFDLHQHQKTTHLNEDGDTPLFGLRKQGQQDQPIVLDAKEQKIAQSPRLSALYAKEIGKRWPPGEPAIAKDAKWSVFYAANVLRKRFPAGERVIAKSPRYSAEYAIKVLHGRWRPGEPTIFSNKRATEQYDEYLERMRQQHEKIRRGLPDDDYDADYYFDPDE